MNDVQRGLAVLAVAVMLMVGLSQPADAAQARARGVKAQLFQRWDLNKDGTLTPEEWQGSTPFADADGDGDGLVTPDELSASPVTVGAQIPPRAARPGGEDAATDRWTEDMYDWKGSSSRTRYRGDLEQGKIRVTQEVRSRDADGDDRVSREEWDGEQSEWDQLDRDADGFLTLDEFSDALARGDKRHPPEDPEAEGVVQENGERSDSEGRAEARRAWDPSRAQRGAIARGPAMPAMGASQAGSGDGQVGGEEGDREQAEPDLLDPNEDGSLSAEEDEGEDEPDPD